MILCVAGALMAIVMILLLVLPAPVDIHGEDEHNHQNVRPSLAETAAHAVPLIMFLMIGPTVISVDRGNIAASTAVMAIPQTKKNGNDELHYNDKGYSELTLLGLYVMPIFSKENVKVQLIGRVFIPTKDDLSELPSSSDFNKMRVFIYQYYIWCCAADARQVSVAIRNIPPEAVKEDAWVLIRGTSYPPDEVVPLMSIFVEEMEDIPEPENPFIQ